MHAGIGAEVVYGGTTPRAERQSTLAADYQVFCNRVAADEGRAPALYALLARYYRQDPAV